MNFGTDVDECTASNGNCSQKCVNTIGSYMCSCVNGQGLNNDNKTCSGKDRGDLIMHKYQDYVIYFQTLTSV